MTARTFYLSFDVLSEVRFCYFDYDEYKRVLFLPDSYLMFNDIRCMYVEDDVLYVEVYTDDE